MEEKALKDAFKLLVRGRAASQPAASQPTESQPGAPLPEPDKRTLSDIAEHVFSPVIALGNAVDVPGAVARNIIGGGNPVAPLANPFGAEGRIEGRQLWRNIGAASDEDTWANFGAGLALEAALDPTNAIKSSLTRGGKALRMMGLDKEVKNTAREMTGEKAKWTSKISTSPKQVLQRQAAGDQAEYDRLVQAFLDKGGKMEDLERSVGGYLGIGVPLTNLDRQLGARDVKGDFTVAKKQARQTPPPGGNQSAGGAGPSSTPPPGGNQAAGVTGQQVNPPAPGQSSVVIAPPPAVTGVAAPPAPPLPITVSQTFPAPSSAAPPTSQQAAPPAQGSAKGKGKKKKAADALITPLTQQQIEDRLLARATPTETLASSQAAPPTTAIEQPAQNITPPVKEEIPAVEQRMEEVAAGTPVVEQAAPSATDALPEIKTEAPPAASALPEVKAEAPPAIKETPPVKVATKAVKVEPIKTTTSASVPEVKGQQAAPSIPKLNVVAKKPLAEVYKPEKLDDIRKTHEALVNEQNELLKIWWGNEDELTRGGAIAKKILGSIDLNDTKGVNIKAKDLLTRRVKKGDLLTPDKLLRDAAGGDEAKYQSYLDDFYNNGGKTSDLDDDVYQPNNFHDLFRSSLPALERRMRVVEEFRRDAIERGADPDELLGKYSPPSFTTKGEKGGATTLSWGDVDRELEYPLNRLMDKLEFAPVNVGGADGGIGGFRVDSGANEYIDIDGRLINKNTEDGLDALTASHHASEEMRQGLLDNVPGIRTLATLLDQGADTAQIIDKLRGLPEARMVLQTIMERNIPGYNRAKAMRNMHVLQALSKGDTRRAMDIMDGVLDAGDITPLVNLNDIKARVKQASKDTPFYSQRFRWDRQGSGFSGAPKSAEGSVSQLADVVLSTKKGTKLVIGRDGIARIKDPSTLNEATRNRPSIANTENSVYIGADAARLLYEVRLEGDARVRLVAISDSGTNKRRPILLIETRDIDTGRYKLHPRIISPAGPLDNILVSKEDTLSDPKSLYFTFKPEEGKHVLLLGNSNNPELGTYNDWSIVPAIDEISQPVKAEAPKPTKQPKSTAEAAQQSAPKAKEQPTQTPKGEPAAKTEAGTQVDPTAQATTEAPAPPRKKVTPNVPKVEPVAPVREKPNIVVKQVAPQGKDVEAPTVSSITPEQAKKALHDRGLNIVQKTVATRERDKTIWTITARNGNLRDFARELSTLNAKVSNPDQWNKVPYATVWDDVIRKLGGKDPYVTIEEAFQGKGAGPGESASGEFNISEFGKPVGIEPLRTGQEPRDGQFVTSKWGYTPDYDVSGLPEDVKRNLRPHQQEAYVAATASMEKHGAFLLADGPGTGKTRVILQTADTFTDENHFSLILTKHEVLGKPFEVGGTGEISGSYANDAKAMGIETHLIRDMDDLPNGFENGKIYIASYHLLKHIYDSAKKSAGRMNIFLDESHEAKNMWSSEGNARMIGNLANDSNRVLFATATPIDAEENLLYLTRLGFIPEGVSFDEFLRKFVGIELVEGYSNGQLTQRWKPVEGVNAADISKNIDYIFTQLTKQGIMLKRELSMDGVNIQVHKTAIPEPVRQMLRKIDGAFGPTGLQRAQAVTAMRNYLEHTKVKQAVDIAMSEAASGKKVVIYTANVRDPKIRSGGRVLAEVTGTAKLVREELIRRGVPQNKITELHSEAKKQVVKKNGKVTNPKLTASEAMGDFQDGDAQYMIATMESGGTGINLDDTTGEFGRAMIIMTPPWSPISSIQAVGRVWRANTVSNPTIHFILSDAAIDQSNAAALSAKMKSLRAVVEGEVARLDPEVIERMQYLSQAQLENLDLNKLAELNNQPVKSADQAAPVIPEKSPAVTQKPETLASEQPVAKQEAVAKEPVPEPVKEAAPVFEAGTIKAAAPDNEFTFDDVLHLLPPENADELAEASKRGAASLFSLKESTAEKVTAAMDDIVAKAKELDDIEDVATRIEEGVKLSKSLKSLAGNLSKLKKQVSASDILAYGDTSGESFNRIRRVNELIKKVHNGDPLEQVDAISREAFRDQVAKHTGASDEDIDIVMSFTDMLAKSIGSMSNSGSSLYFMSKLAGITNEAPVDVFNELQRQAKGAARGGVQFLPDGKAVIYAFQGSEPGTIVHELAHIYRRTVSEIAQVDPVVRAYMDKIEEWAGVADGAWTPAAEEKFVEGLMDFIKTGDAPSLEMKTVFQKIAEWIKSVYNTIIGTKYASSLTPEVKQAFSDLLAGIGSKTDITFAERMAKIREATAKGGVSVLAQAKNKQVYSDNFKNWFGDWENNPSEASKAVDEFGQPKVFYHGTLGGNFSEFRKDAPRDSVNKRPTISVTPDPEFASMYAGRTMNGEYQRGGRVYPVYINAKNIADYRNPNHVELKLQLDVERQEDFLRNKANRVAWKIPDEESLLAKLDEYRNARRKSLETGTWSNWEDEEFLRKHGFDGVWVNEGPATDYAHVVNLSVLNPSQIKSVANQGTFNPASNDILAQGTGHFVEDSLDSIQATMDKVIDYIPGARAASQIFRAVFDPDVRESLTKSGQELAEQESAALQASIERARGEIVELVRTVDNSKIFSRAKYKNMSNKDIDDAINFRAQSIKRALERKSDVEFNSVMDQLVKFDPDIEQIRPELLKVREFLKKMLDEIRSEGIDVRSLNDALAYLPINQAAAPIQGVKSMLMRATEGNRTLDTNSPHFEARSYFLKGWPGGQAFVDRLSLDNRISGFTHRKQILDNNLTREQLNELGDIVIAEYSDEIIPPKIAKDPVKVKKFLESPDFQQRLKGLVGFIANLHPAYADKQMPVFSRNFVHTIMGYAEDSMRAISNMKIVKKTFSQMADTAETVKSLDNAASQGEKSVPIWDNVLKEMEMHDSPMTRASILQSMPDQVASLAREVKRFKLAGGAPKNEYEIRLEKLITQQSATVSTTKAAVKALRKRLKLYANAKINIGINDKTITALLANARSSHKDFDRMIELVKGIERRAEKRLAAVVPATALEEPGIAKSILNIQETHDDLRKEMFNNMFVQRSFADDLRRIYAKNDNSQIGASLLNLLRVATQFQKAHQTAPFPAFHNRNLLSGQMLNYMTGLYGGGPLRGMAGLFRGIRNAVSLLQGKTIEGAASWPMFKGMGLTDEQASKEIANLAFKYYLIGERMGVGATDMADDMSSAASQLAGTSTFKFNEIEKPADATIWSFLSPWMQKGLGSDQDHFLGAYLRGMKWWGNTVEGLNRIAPFIELVRNGYNPRAAADMVKKAQVDYTRLTRIERKYFKMLVPYYGFHRGIMPFVATELLTKPGGGLSTLIKTISRSRDESETAPDYIQETTAVPLPFLDTSDGTKSYITGFGLAHEDPASFFGLAGGDISGGLREGLSRLNPLIRAPIEYAMGSSTWQGGGPGGGRLLEDMDPLVGRLASNIYDDVTGENTVKAKPLFGSRGVEFAIANSPAGRYLGTARTLTDKRKWDGPANIPVNLLSNLLTGINVSQVSPATQDSVAKDRATQAMKDMGGRYMTTPYFPEEVVAEMSPEDQEKAADIKELLGVLAKRARARKKEREAKETAAQ